MKPSQLDMLTARFFGIPVAQLPALDAQDWIAHRNATMVVLCLALPIAFLGYAHLAGLLFGWVDEQYRLAVHLIGGLFGASLAWHNDRNITVMLRRETSRSAKVAGISVPGTLMFLGAAVTAVMAASYIFRPQIEYQQQMAIVEGIRDSRDSTRELYSLSAFDEQLSTATTALGTAKVQLDTLPDEVLELQRNVRTCTADAASKEAALRTTRTSSYQRLDTLRSSLRRWNSDGTSYVLSESTEPEIERIETKLRSDAAGLAALTKRCDADEKLANQLAAAHRTAHQELVAQAQQKHDQAQAAHETASGKQQTRFVAMEEATIGAHSSNLGSAIEAMMRIAQSGLTGTFGLLLVFLISLLIELSPIAYGSTLAGGPVDASLRAEQQHALLAAQIREATAIATSEATLDAERAKGALRAAVTAEVDASIHLAREMLRMQTELDRIAKDLRDTDITMEIARATMTKLTQISSSYV